MRTQLVPGQSRARLAAWHEPTEELADQVDFAPHGTNSDPPAAEMLGEVTVPAAVRPRRRLTWSEQTQMAVQASVPPHRRLGARYLPALRETRVLALRP